MANLAQCKGQSPCPNKETPVIFSIGGEGYSEKPWSWLKSKSEAEAMAAKVAVKSLSKYQVDKFWKL